VLGMHKSGTTLIAKMLHHSNINMVDCLSDLNYDQGNKYERSSMVFTNLAILNIAFSEKSYTSLKYQTDHPRYEPSIVENQVKYLIAHLNEQHENWGFKDPRTCLTYSIWKKHLGQHFVIGAFRSPWSVLNHYTSKRKLGKFRYDIIFQVLKSWYVHNEVVLNEMSQSNSTLIYYDDMMSNHNMIKSLSKVLKINITDLRNRKLNRSSNSTFWMSKIVCFILKLFYRMDIAKLFSTLQDRSLA